MSESITESINPETVGIDGISSLEIVTLINREDARVAQAVEGELPKIAQAVDLVVERLQQGGKMFYFGAGTSGRIGVLDASELPPTFNTSPELVQGIIAGGDAALRRSAEGAEDDREAGRQAAVEAGVGERDVAVGISASGGAPWAAGALEAARERGAKTIALVCNPDGPLTRLADIAIAPITGPEVIAGSTRMKAGTAQKMVLNMLSTAVMVRLGKVYGNRMVDMRATNQKLRRRAVHMVQEIAGVDAQAAVEALEETGYEVKPALVMLIAGVNLSEARRRLEAANGVVREAIGQGSRGAGERGSKGEGE